MLKYFENKLLKLKGQKVFRNENFTLYRCKINDNNILVENKDNTLKGKANLGTTRALINNMMIGVTMVLLKN